MTMWRARDLVTCLLAKSKIQTLGDILGNVEARKLVDILADNIAEAKAETLGHTVGDVEAVDTSLIC